MVSNLKACLATPFSPRGFPSNYVHFGVQNYPIMIRKYSHFKGAKELVQTADNPIFNILSDPEVVRLPKTLRDGNERKPGRREEGVNSTALNCSEV